MGVSGLVSVSTRDPEGGEPVRWVNSQAVEEVRYSGQRDERLLRGENAVDPGQVFHWLKSAGGTGFINSYPPGKRCRRRHWEQFRRPTPRGGALVCNLKFEQQAALMNCGVLGTTRVVGRFRGSVPNVNGRSTSSVGGTGLREGIETVSAGLIMGSLSQPELS